MSQAGGEFAAGEVLAIPRAESDDSCKKPCG